MAKYNIGFQSAAAASGAAYCAFRAPSNASRIFEVGLACNAATASAISLFRNTAAGYTATTSVGPGQGEYTTDPVGTSLVDTAWSTAPTITAANRLRRFGLPATIGAALIWVFQNGLYVRSATATDILVIWNEGGTAGSALNGYIAYEE